MIRFANDADLAEIARIEAQLFSQPWSEQGFRDALTSPNAKIFVCEEQVEDKSKIAGYLCMYISFDEGEITNVAVSTEARGKGYGVALLSAVKEFAKENAITHIVLEVRVSNAPAIGLYEKMGFANLGIRKGFYDMPKEDAMIMALESI